MPRSLLPFIALLLAASCAPYHPPYTVPAGPAPIALAGERDATLVFLWPTTSCDPAGYFTLATTDGRFLGTISPKTQLRVSMPAGRYSVVGWNPTMEDALGGATIANVPVVHATLAEGRTYYVRLSFGEWDERGPRQFISGTVMGGHSSNRCGATASGQNTTSAMVRLTPSSRGLGEVQEWTDGLEVLVPDAAAGQRWLETQHEVLEAHASAAERRYERLRDDARALATVAPEDGVDGRP